MRTKKNGRVFWLSSIVLLIMAAGIPAGATSHTFYCRASLVRVERVNHWVKKALELAQQDVDPINIEPIVANSASSTCASDSAGSPVPVLLPGDLGSVAARQVSTTSTASSASAISRVADIVLTLPNLPTIKIERAFGSESSVSCSSGTVSLSGSSTVKRIEIGAPVNQTIEVPDVLPGADIGEDQGGDSHHRHVTIPSVVGTSTVIHLNHVYTYDRDGNGTNDSQYRAAVMIVPNTTVQPSTTVIGETSVGVSGCA